MGASSCEKLAFPKALPHVVDKHAEAIARERDDRIERQRVRERDGKWCRCCGWRRATEVHEALVFRSHGGRPSLENSVFLCAEPQGVCHQLAQKHRITVEGSHCSQRIKFRMSVRIAKVVRPLRSDERRRIVIE
jgi:hypothetical protein